MSTSHPESSGPPPGPSDALSPSQFLAELGRELTVPMNRMMGTARLLLEAELPPSQQAMVHEISHSGDALLRLIQDALDVAGAEAGGSKPPAIPFDLRLLMDETVGRLRPRAQRKGAAIEYRVHHEVPSRLIGDAGRVRQVLWNLGAYAVDVLRAGSLVLRVGRLQEQDDSVTLRFEARWYREPESGETTDAPGISAPRGSRLHLSIATRLAALIPGTITVEGDADSPAVAWLDVGFRKQAETPVGEAPTRPGGDLAKARVLIADPNAVARQSTAAKLQAAGCRTADAPSAEDALGLWREASAAGDPFRFVLVERDLPLMSPDELAAALRADTGARAPLLVLLAAVGRRGDLERARAAGFSAYLSMPLDGPELAAALVETERIAGSGPSEGEPPLVTRHWLTELRRSRTRILIIEDDVVSSLVTDWTLRRMGYQVRRLRTAAETRELLSAGSTPFGLVVLALRLPDADGLSLIDELRGGAAQESPAAIVTIGYAGTREERERCHAAGVDAYVSSPVDLAQLCAVVEGVTRTGASRDPEAHEDDEASSSKSRAPTSGKVALRFNVDPETGQLRAPAGGAQVPASQAMAETPLVTSMEDLSADQPEIGDDSLPAAARVESAPTDPAPTAEVPAAPTASAPPPAAQGSNGRSGPGGARPILNLERLNQATSGNAALRAQVLGSFLRQVRGGLEQLGQAVASGDAERVRSETERLAELAESVGALACAETLAAIRRLGTDRPIADAVPLLAEVSREIGRLERVTSLVGPGQGTGTQAAA